jgi:hypothetical protein
MAKNVVTVKIDADTGDAVKEIEKVKDGVKEVSKETEVSSGSFSALGDVAETMSGGVISGFVKMYNSIKDAVRGMGFLRAAFAATGIGLIITGLASLASWMKTTEKGSETLAVASTTIDIIWKQSIDTLAGFVGITGDAEEASKSWAKTIAGMVSTVFPQLAASIYTAVAVSEEMVKVQNELIAATAKFTVENANLNGEIERQQKIIDDTTLSYGKRKDALKAQSSASVQLAENTEKQARLDLATLENNIRLAVSDSDKKELKQGLAEATASVIEAETRLAVLNLDNAQKSREIDREEVDRKRSIQQQLNDLRLESLDDEKEVESERLALAEIAGLEQLELFRASEEQKQALRDSYALIRYNREKKAQAIIDAEALAQQAIKDEAELLLQEKDEEKRRFLSAQLVAERKIADDKEISDAQKVAESKRQLAEAAFSAVQDLAVMFGEGDEKRARKAFEVNKALNIGKALISTYQAVNTIIKAEDIPNAAKPFVIAAAVGTGLVNVAKIKSTQFGSVSGGPPPSPPSFGGSGGSSSAPQLNTDALQTDNQTSIRAYVVSKDVTTASAQNQQIEQQANLVL